MSTLTYLHEVNEKFIKEGRKIIHEEKITDGTKGLYIKYFNKEGDKTEKLEIIGREGEYVVKTTEDDKKEERTMNKNELLAFLGKGKKYKFIVDFLNLQKGGTESGPVMLSREYAMSREERESMKGPR